VSDLASDLLWLGIEDFTGLWDAGFQAQATEEITTRETARDRARSVLESLLAEGLVELYLFRGPPQNDAVAVAPDARAALLCNDECWAVPEEGGAASVWFATTDKGFQLYRKEHNWAG
jgi:hypothetical protein